MNTKLKYVGLLAILPLFLIVLAPDYIGEADARSFSQTPYPHVASTDVSSSATAKAPSVEFMGAWALIGGAYQEHIATFKVFAGDSTIQDIKLLVNSDLETVQLDGIDNGRFDGKMTLSAGDYSTVAVHIKASDTSAFNAELSYKTLE